jgi:hypothetical protein
MRIRPVPRRLLTGIVFAALLPQSARALTAGEAIQSARRPVESLIRTLEANPHLAPAAVTGERPVQIVLRTDASGKIREGMVLPLRNGSLDRDRDRQIRTGRRGDGWLVLLDPTTHHPVWWAPVAAPQELHQELLVRSSLISGRIETRAEGIVSVRAPFVPGGIVIRTQSRLPFETLVADEAMVLGAHFEDGIRVLPAGGTP